jgi:hypothetical protein
MNNVRYQGIEAKLPQVMEWYATVAPATPLLPFVLTVFAIFLARGNNLDRDAVFIRLVVNRGWMLGVVLPIAVIVLWQLPFMLIGTRI